MGSWDPLWNALGSVFGGPGYNLLQSVQPKIDQIKSQAQHSTMIPHAQPKQAAQAEHCSEAAALEI